MGQGVLGWRPCTQEWKGKGPVTECGQKEALNRWASGDMVSKLSPGDSLKVRTWGPPTARRLLSPPLYTGCFLQVSLQKAFQCFKAKKGHSLHYRKEVSITLYCTCWDLKATIEQESRAPQRAPHCHSAPLLNLRFFKETTCTSSAIRDWKVEK